MATVTPENDFNPAVTTYDGQTLPDSELIQMAITANNKELHTWLPAKVIGIVDTNTVAIQPMLLRVFVINPTQPVALPPIQRAMIMQPRGNGYAVKLPVAVGDTGIALFCERSLDVWSVNGGMVDPADDRTHALSDAVFYPGLFPFSQPILPPVGANPTDMVLQNGSARIYLNADGGFRIVNNASGQDLLTILSNLLTQVTAMNTALVAATVNTIFGAVPLNNFATFTGINTQIATLTSELATLLGVGS